MGRVAERWLKQSDFDVRVVRDEDPNMLDYDILAWAVVEGRVIVTMDKDFGELVYRESLQHEGILLLRLRQETAQDKIKVLGEILMHFADELSGNFSVYQRGRLRIR